MVSRETLQELAAFEFDPMNDVAFKFLFGSEKRKQITLAFLNAILEPWIGRTIKDLEFLPTEMVPYSDSGKLTRLDVVCKLDDCETVNVEVQVVNYKEMDHRTLYYWAQLFLKALKKADRYRDLKPVITINILSFNLFPEPDDDPHDVYSVCSLKSYRRMNRDMELHFLELPKYRNYRKKNKNSVAEMSSLERWLAFFANNLNIDEQEELVMADAAISTALEESRIFLSDTAEQLDYLNRRMAIMDYNSGMADSYEDGLAKGEKKGEKKGEEKGVKKVAIAMLKNKVPFDTIQLYTSLSQAQIEQIAKDNNLM